jgi:DNA helicase-2/ATP-dependent DNA helicase PcrA
MPNITYTPDQRDAIEHRDGNLLILACAGSGKTEVISRRIAGLVAEGTPKSSIIAFTFTERAAKELKARIRGHLEELQPDDPAVGDMYVGTIHSFCLQLLKEIDASYRKFEVMDEARQAALISRHFHQDIGLRPLRNRVRGNGYWRTIKRFSTTLSVVHQQDIPLADIEDGTVRDAIQNYREIAYGDPNYFFDFDQIISELIQVLENRPQKLEELRDRFTHLVVDEYQDVDDRQERLIHLLSAGGTEVQVTAVGDDDQAIYGWRGAVVDNILTFTERYPDVTPVTLDYNFRSSHAIVEIANRAIREIPEDRRTPKEMEARHWEAEEEEFAETMADEGDIQLRTFEGNPGEDRDDAKETAIEREANWIADQIEELRGTIIREKDGSERAIDYADMAILLRVNSVGEDYASALEERGIPYVVKGTGGLFDHDEAMLVQAGFALVSRSDLLVEVEDDDDGYVVLNEQQTRDYARELIEELRESGAMPTASSARFFEWIAEKREELDNKANGEGSRRIYPQDIFHEMLSVLGADQGPDPWPQKTMFNLGRVSDLITQYEAVHPWVRPGQLQSLCVFLGGWAAGNVDEGSLDEALTPNAVQILTVHKAKGLEWPAVFIPRVSSRKFPHQNRNQGPDTFLDDTVFDADEYASGDEGERRLWYVALTRCRKFLHITGLDVPYTRPTDYLEEITHDYVQRQGDIPDRDKGTPTRPATAELLPTTYSDLECYWRCPFEYQLRSLMDFSPGVKEAYGYGQQIHNSLAEIHQRALDGEEITEEEAREIVEDRFHLRYTSGEPLEDLKAAAKDSIGRYLDQYPDNTEFVLRAEQPFEFVDEQSGALINGTIDLLERIDRTPSGEEEREPVAVVDFKTHRWETFDDYLSTKEAVENQLRMYAIAVREALGFDADEARAQIISPQGPPQELIDQGATEQIDVDISQPKLGEVMGRVRESIAEIEETIQNDDEGFPLRGVQNGHCPDCDFKTFCPGFTQFQENSGDE